MCRCCDGMHTVRSAQRRILSSTSLNNFSFLKQRNQSKHHDAGRFSGACMCIVRIGIASAKSCPVRKRMSPTRSILYGRIVVCSAKWCFQTTALCCRGAKLDIIEKARAFGFYFAVVCLINKKVGISLNNSVIVKRWTVGSDVFYRPAGALFKLNTLYDPCVSHAFTWVPRSWTFASPPSS